VPDTFYRHILSGLNIQAASVVILFEPQWKPSIEEQAIARAYRMGQARRVIVHRLIARNSIEERILKVLEQKSDLFDQFARQSALKKASGEAVRTEAIKKQVFKAELKRLGVE